MRDLNETYCFIDTRNYNENDQNIFKNYPEFSHLAGKRFMLIEPITMLDTDEIPPDNYEFFNSGWYFFKNM